MKLWIRSQDKKTLMKVTRLYVFSNTIFSVDTRESELILGTYKTKERALEVLDEISDIMTNLADSDLKLIQYEMPKE